jgi:hypothetical protein
MRASHLDRERSFNFVCNKGRLAFRHRGVLCENWRDPASGEWIRTFAIITTEANELVAESRNHRTRPSEGFQKERREPGQN